MHVYSEVVKFLIHFHVVINYKRSIYSLFIVVKHLDCQDLLTRLLEPSPTKRITISEILRHPFLVHQLGPIELSPFKPHTDVREINRHILRYLNVK